MNIAILGRGIAGLNLAFRLVEKGFNITIFGQKDQGIRASSAAQGLICNKGLLKGFHPLFKAKLNSLEFIKRRLDYIEKKTQSRIRRNFSGVYEVYDSPAHYQRIVKRVYKGQFTGPFNVKNLPIDNELLRYFPGAIGTLFYAKDGWYSAIDLMNALESYLRLECGVKFFNEEVTAINPDSSGRPRLYSEHHGRQISFDRLVLAAGAGTPALLNKLDVALTDFFYHPGQCLRIPLPIISGFSFVNQTLSLIGDSSLTVGSTTDKVEKPFQGYNLEAGRVKLFEALRADFRLSKDILSSCRAVKYEDLWGTRLRLKNRQPVFGSLRTIEARLGNVFILTGFYKNGLHLADMFSEWLVDEIVSGHVQELAAPFHVTRL